MKKFLIKAIAAAVSLTTASGSCMAWTNKRIQREYEQKFGWYTTKNRGLKAIIFLLTDGKTMCCKSKEDMQRYLELNYEHFRPKFDQINETDIERQYERFMVYFPESPQKNSVIETLSRIKKTFPEIGVKNTDLSNFAKIIAVTLNVNLISYNKMRSRSTLLMWFDHNWEKISANRLLLQDSIRFQQEPAVDESSTPLQQEPVVDEGSTPSQQEPVVDEGSTPPQQDPTVDEDSTPSQQEPIFDDSFFFSDDSLFPSDDYYSFCFDDFFPAFF